MIKLVVTDIDGTILDESNVFRPAIIKTIKKLEDLGIPVVLATGRVFAGVYPAAQQLGLKNPIICSQGSIIRQDENTLWKRPVEHNLAREIIALLRKKKIHTNLYNDDEIFVEDDRYMDKYSNGRFVTYNLIENFDDINLGVVSKLLAIVYDEEQMQSICCELKERYKGVLTIVRSHKYYLEITDIEATKGNAMKHLAELWGVKKEEIFASGDQDNDIDLLLNAGIKVATEYASEGLKAIADFICPSPAEDGWVCAIERFILNEGVSK